MIGTDETMKGKRMPPVTEAEVQGPRCVPGLPHHEGAGPSKRTYRLPGQSTEGPGNIRALCPQPASSGIFPAYTPPWLTALAQITFH